MIILYIFRLQSHILPCWKQNNNSSSSFTEFSQFQIAYYNYQHQHLHTILFSPLVVLIVVSQSSLVELLKLPAQPRYSAVGLVDCAGRLYRSASAEESRVVSWSKTPQFTMPRPKRAVSIAIMGAFQEVKQCGNCPNFELTAPLQSTFSWPLFFALRNSGCWCLLCVIGREQKEVWRGWGFRGHRGFWWHRLWFRGSRHDRSSENSVCQWHQSPVHTYWGRIRWRHRSNLQYK